MQPVNVKLADDRLRRLDAGIAQGRAANRSDALREALDRLLREWDREAWNDAWALAIPDTEDEFISYRSLAIKGWDELDGDR